MIARIKCFVGKCKKALLAGGIALGASAPAWASGEPLDLTAAGTTLAGYVAVAAGAALALWLAYQGVRVILRAFKAVK